MPKILIFEDEQTVAEMLMIKFKSLGYEVVLFKSGEQAVRRALKENPDLVLIESVLPNVDGFEVARQLSAHQKTRIIPRLLFSLPPIDGSPETTPGSSGVVFKNPQDLVKLARELIESRYS